MNSMWLLLILVLNFVISWWNAYVTGKCWAESKAIGGWIRLVTWSAAVQSALGFSSVYICFLGFGLYGIGYLDNRMLELVMSLWYVTVIIPILGSGLIITMESWRQWWRERDLLSLGISAWNTYAQIHNTLSAVESMGDALRVVGEAFIGAFDSDDDAQSAIGKAGLMIALLIVAIAVLGGVLHTVLLIKKYAATDPVPSRQAVPA